MFPELNTYFPYISFRNKEDIKLCDVYKGMSNSIKSSVLSINFINKEKLSTVEFNCIDKENFTYFIPD